MTVKRRILLVEIKPLVPQAKTYATWSTTDKDADITLSGGNLVATCAAGQIGALRATVDMTSGQWYWETTYTTLPDPGYVMATGIATSAWSLTASVAMGADLTQYSQAGPRQSDGNCYFNNALTGTVGAVAAANVIGHWYDADSGRYKVRKNGGAWQDLGRRPALTRNGWFPAASLARNAKVTANFGASAFAYAVPFGANPGVYSLPDPVETTVYIASEGFNTGSADTPASTHYAGRIASDFDLVTQREGGCWVWGNQSRSSRGQISVVANDGELDGWLDWLWRDADVRIYAGYEGDARSAFVLRSKERVESVTLSESRWTITLADQLALLDRAIPRPIYSGSVGNASLAFTPSPIVFGKPLYCEGALRQTATTGNDAFAYDLSSNPVLIDAAYDRGDIFTPFTDWHATQDGLGFKLINDPDEPVTAHPVGGWKFGASDLIDTDFATWGGSPSVPTGWTQLGAAWNVTNRFQQWNTSECRLRAAGSQVVQMYNSATSLTAGYWRVTFDVLTVTTAGVVNFIVGGNNRFVRIDRVGAFSCIVQAAATAQIQFIAGNDGTNVLGAIDVVIDNFKVRSATLIDHLGEWTKALSETMGGVTVDSASAAALEGKADYRLAHYSNEDETILSILRKTLDGWCGWLVPKLDGTIAVGRVDLPAETASLNLSDLQVQSVSVSLDVAKGLTTRIAGRRNHRVHSDSDIATSVAGDLRADLKTEYTYRSAQPTVLQIGLSSGSGSPPTVSADVKQADGAPARPTLLQEPDDLQAEISRVATLWREQRRFYSVACLLDAVAGDAIEPGQTVNLVWPRYGLDSGRNLLVIGVTTRFWSRVVNLTLWG